MVTCAHRVEGLGVEYIDAVHGVVLEAGPGLHRCEESLKGLGQRADFLVLRRQALQSSLLVVEGAVGVLHPVHQEHVPAPGHGGHSHPSDQDDILSDALPPLVRGRPLEEVLGRLLLVDS